MAASYKKSWKFVFVAGCMPFVVGITGYATAVIRSIALFPDSPFVVLWKTSKQSFRSIEQTNAEFSSFFAAATIGFWQLLIVLGFTICCLSYFGIRTGQKWSWFACLAVLLWGAGNDTFIAVFLWQRDAMTIPTPLFVDAVGLFGLYGSRDILRNHASIP